MPSGTILTAGIDVGGARKGFHAVVFRNGAYQANFASREAVEIVRWCQAQGAQVVGVDAPSGWSEDGRARPSERALMQAGISCFASPTRVAARMHPKNYFGWMLCGEELFAVLQESYALFDGQAPLEQSRLCFETYPHGIACALAGEPVSAREKRQVRRRLLEGAGVDTAALSNIDELDGALCALAAYRFVCGEYVSYGGVGCSSIVLPRLALG